MFWKRNTIAAQRILFENIKREIKEHLYEKGILVSGINLEINCEKISMSIHISNMPSTRQLSQTNFYISE